MNLMPSPNQRRPPTMMNTQFNCSSRAFRFEFRSRIVDWRREDLEDIKGKPVTISPREKPATINLSLLNSPPTSPRDAAKKEPEEPKKEVEEDQKVEEEVKKEGESKSGHE